MRLYDHPYRLLACFILIPTLLFLLGLSYTDIALVRKAYIKEIEFLTGAWCWSIACFLLFTATRPRFIEKWGSLDSYYHCHKILGIACTILSIIHFFGKDIGIYITTACFTFPEGVTMPANTWPLVAFTSIAKESALIVSTIALLLVIITFIPQIRYALWLRLHRILAIVGIFISLHVLILLRDNQVITPLGILTILMTLVALFSCVISLLGLNGKNKRFAATLTKITVGNKYLQLRLQATKYPEHIRAGNFIFLAFKGYNAHPYTVQSTSINPDNNNLQFTLLIKRGGRFASILEAQLHENETLRCEGPYGLFALPLPQAGEHNLWLGQGVGMSALYDAVTSLPEHSSSMQGQLTIVLLTRHEDQDEVIPDLQKAYAQLSATQQDKIKFIVHDSANSGRISPERLQELCTGINEFYFCGDSKLKATALKSFIAAGGQKTNFHVEYATWR